MALVSKEHFMYYLCTIIVNQNGALPITVYFFSHLWEVNAKEQILILVI